MTSGGLEAHSSSLPRTAVQANNKRKKHALCDLLHFQSAHIFPPCLAMVPIGSVLMGMHDGTGSLQVIRTFGAINVALLGTMDGELAASSAMRSWGQPLVNLGLQEELGHRGTDIAYLDLHC